MKFEFTKLAVSANNIEKVSKPEQWCTAELVALVMVVVCEVTRKNGGQSDMACLLVFTHAVKHTTCGNSQPQM